MSGWGGGWSSQVVVANQMIIDGPGELVLVYSGSPALGDLIYSIAAVAGTDQPGNHYLKGEASYANDGFGTFIQELAGILKFGNSTYSGINAGSINLQTNGSLLIQAGSLGGGLQLNQDGTIQILENRALIASQSSGSEEVWHYVGTAGNPAFATGWANSGSGNADLAFRLQADTGMVEIDGLITASAGAGGTVFTLPAAYIPVSNQVIFAFNLTTNVAERANVLTTGAVSLSSVTAGDSYSVSGRYSLAI